MNIHTAIQAYMRFTSITYGYGIHAGVDVVFLSQLEMIQYDVVLVCGVIVYNVNFYGEEDFNLIQLLLLVMSMRMTTVMMMMIRVIGNGDVRCVRLSIHFHLIHIQYTASIQIQTKYMYLNGIHVISIHVGDDYMCGACGVRLFMKPFCMTVVCLFACQPDCLPPQLPSFFIILTS